MSVLAAGAADLDLDAPLASFAREGYARLGPVLAGDAMVALRARADDIMLGRVVHHGLFFQQDTTTGRYDDLEFGKGWTGPSLNYRKIEKLERDPLFLAWIQNPLFGRIARALLGEAVTLYRAVLFSKAALGGTVLPWHQDGGRFWGLDCDPILQIGRPSTTPPSPPAASRCCPGATVTAWPPPSAASCPRRSPPRVTPRRAPSPCRPAPARRC